MVRALKMTLAEAFPGAGKLKLKGCHGDCQTIAESAELGGGKVQPLPTEKGNIL